MQVMQHNVYETLVKRFAINICFKRCI